MPKVEKLAVQLTKDHTTCWFSSFQMFGPWLWNPLSDDL